MAASDDDLAALAAAIDGPIHALHDRTPGTVGVAVSGGGDSTALLLAAEQWAAPRGIAVHAATVDHGLRPEAAHEARAVAALCAARGIPHETLRLGLAPGPGVMARARDARYAALTGWARARTGIVLLGHTADDVAESLMMRLSRGVGVDGLAAMPAWWRSPGGPLWGRPFLDRTRADLRAVLAARGVPWHDDPTNADPAHERSRIRAAMAALDLDPASVARAAHSLADAAMSLDERLHDIVTREVEADRGDVVIPAPLVERLDRAERAQLHRLVRRAVAWIGGAPPRGAAVEAALGLRWTAAGDRRTLGGCVLSVEGEPGRARLRIAREAAACAPPVPADRVWDGRWRVWRDGADAAALTVGALGDALPEGWRGTGLPRDTLRASPAVRDADGALVAAPLAGWANGWACRLEPAFADTLRHRILPSR